MIGVAFLIYFNSFPSHIGVLWEENNKDNTTVAKAKYSRNMIDGIETCFVHVEGMTCTSCVDSIERGLSKVTGNNPNTADIYLFKNFIIEFLGIHSVLVALLAQRAEVKYDPEYLLPTQIVNQINDLGFRAQLLDTATGGNAILDVHVCFSSTDSCPGLPN